MLVRLAYGPEITGDGLERINPSLPAPPALNKAAALLGEFDNPDLPVQQGLSPSSCVLTLLRS